MARFGLFKKREKDEELAQQPTISQPLGGSLSIQEAQALLQEIETANLRAISTRLAPIKASAERSLRSIGVLATNMEQEKIKLEGLEQRFKSLVENSRKTIVATLRRESSLELELPESVNDVKKFKEKFEMLMKRVGEVTGSHSKILNNFMKKNASRMREELANLEEFLKQSKSIISDFDQKRVPIVKCSGILNTVSQKVSSLRAGEANVADTLNEISALHDELSRMKTEAESLKNSPEFRAAESLAQRLEKAESQRDDLQSKMLELFSHVSRAFTKYSYGVSKETESRLNLMSSEPWKLLDLPDTSDYSALLLEVRKSVSSGKIQLKDSDKMIHYIDLIAQSLPDFQTRAMQLRQELGLLRNQDTSSFELARQLEQKTAEATERLSRSKDTEELLKRQNEEK
ncbi:MAG: hypothetical protein ACRD99_01805, partial [Nitrososphaera sp.]